MNLSLNSSITPHPFPERRRAFTLIELLVVMAIIAILAAILFPVFSQAKASAKQTMCLSNVRQLGFALRLYENDTDDIWCPDMSLGGAAPFPSQRMWVGYDNRNAPLSNGIFGRVDQPATSTPHEGLIDPYLKNYAIRECPNKPNSMQIAYAVNFFQSGFASDFYAAHPEAQDNEYGPGCRATAISAEGVMSCLGVNESEVQETSNTIVLWEHVASAPVCNFLQRPDWYNGPPHDQVLEDHFKFLHRGGANVLWVDGHAKRMVYSQLRRPMFSVRKDIYPNDGQ